MPKVQKTRFDGMVPTKPHLIFYNRTGQAVAFEPGAAVGIVEDPTRNSPHFKMVIVDVREHRLRFKCICNPTCTVQWEYRLQETGNHSR